jgi:DnaJ family protein C protein 11/ATP-dependent RNA helicase DDX10/DBP4
VPPARSFPPPPSAEKKQSPSAVVSRDATEDDIKKAYRALAQVAHPDKHSSSVLREAASRSFNTLNEAYEILSDKERRRVYDVYGMAGLNAGLEVGRRHKSLREISEEFERARAKERRAQMEAKLNFRGSYGFSFSAAHLFDERVRHRRALIAARRGLPTGGSPFLDLNGVDFNSVFDVPTWSDDATAYVGAQGQMSRGAGAGGLILGLRKTASEHTSWECALVMGSMQSAATFHVQRQLSAHAAGTLAYSYAAAQGGLGLEVGVQRQLSEHSKGHLTWNVGPVGGMSTGAQRAKGKTSWKADVSVGPASSGVAGFIARRLSKKSTFRLGVRLGTTAIDFDIGCTRKMNRETSLGLSVSVGIRGVHLKLRFNHSGQRFQFPILLAPRATVANASASLAIPFAAVGILKRYVVKPYALKLRVEEQAVLRSKHAAQVAADKAEARAAQELLKAQAAARVAKEREKNGLVVERAVFGHFPRRTRPKAGEPIVEGFREETETAEGTDDARGAGTTGTSGDGNGDGNGDGDGATKPAPAPWLDVTVAAQFMVFDSHLDVHAGAHKPSLLGFCDPCPDEKAYLRVRYTYRGVPHEVTVGEDDPLAIPNKAHELPR